MMRKLPALLTHGERELCDTRESTTPAEKAETVLGKSTPEEFYMSFGGGGAQTSKNKKKKKRTVRKEWR